MPVLNAGWKNRHYAMYFLERCKPWANWLPPSADATEREQFEARARAVHELYKDEHHHRDWIDVCERLTEFDELVVSWRLRHIQLVERIIGIRMGTGGSAGASYLKLTLDKKFFPELWEARTLLTE